MLSTEILKTILTSAKVWGNILKILSYDPTIADKPIEDFLLTSQKNQIILEGKKNTLSKVEEVTLCSYQMENLETISPDTTVAQMLEYYKKVVLKKYEHNQEVKDSLAQWGLLKDKAIYWTDNEKDILKETIKNAITFYNKSKLKTLQAILKICGHKIRKEIREKNQSTHSFDEVGKMLKNAGIKIQEQHKGNSDKPTIIIQGQTHGFVSFPGTKASQDSIYYRQNLMMKTLICSNFGFEGLPNIEIHPNLPAGKLEQGVALYYGSIIEKRLMKKYSKAFYFGIENLELLEKAITKDNDYKLMLKIARLLDFKKKNFGKGIYKKQYLAKLSLHFSELMSYNAIKIKTENLFKKKSIVTYDDHLQLFKYFLLEWVEWVVNKRNKEIIKIILKMSNNTKQENKGFVVSVKIGKVHTKNTIRDLLWFYSKEKAESIMFNLQEAAAEKECGYYVID